MGTPTNRGNRANTTLRTPRPIDEEGLNELLAMAVDEMGATYQVPLILISTGCPDHGVDRSFVTDSRPLFSRVVETYH